MWLELTKVRERGVQPGWVGSHNQGEFAAFKKLMLFRVLLAAVEGTDYREAGEEAAAAAVSRERWWRHGLASEWGQVRVRLEAGQDVGKEIKDDARLCFELGGQLRRGR